MKNLIVILCLCLFLSGCATMAWDESRLLQMEEGIKKIRIGMTTEEVFKYMGQPNEINKSVSSWGVRHQCIYKKPSSWDYGYLEMKYFLYFENWILDSWQEN